MNKKGQGSITGVFASIIGIALVLMVAGIFMAYQADIVSDIHDDFDANSYGANITDQNLEATDDLANKQGTLTNIAVAVVIISLLLIAASVIGIRIAG